MAPVSRRRPASENYSEGLSKPYFCANPAVTLSHINFSFINITHDEEKPAERPRNYRGGN